MRFYFAKKNMTCKGCPIDIQRGEVYVRSFFKTPNNGYYSFSYHPQCFLKSFERRFLNSLNYWVEKLIPPKKLGRPLVDTLDRPKRRRLLSLMVYHKKAGNTVRVKAIQQQIYEIENI